MELRVMNADRTNPLEFSGCLHTYFRFEDTSRVELLGFRNAAFIDKADGRQQKIQKGPINIETEAMRTAKSSGAKYGYVHRVYHQNPGTFEFKNLATRKVLIKVTHSKSWPDTTVYNPWLGDKQGMEKGPDFDDDGYTKTISLEPTISGDHAVKLAPGESWVGYQQIEVPLNDDAAKSLHKRSYSTEKSTR